MWFLAKDYFIEELFSTGLLDPDERPNNKTSPDKVNNSQNIISCHKADVLSPKNDIISVD